MRPDLEEHVVATGSREEIYQFIARSPDGGAAGESRMILRIASDLFPQRPLLIEIEMEGDEEAWDALYGAAHARALVMRRRYSDLPARLYTAFAPEETRKQAFFRSHHLNPQEGEQRFVRELPKGPQLTWLPSGLTWVNDVLAKPGQAQAYLARLNDVLLPKRGMEWLAGMYTQDMFCHTQVVNAQGPVAEMLCYCDTHEGKPAGAVGPVFVHPDYRLQGIARFLLEQARVYFYDRGITVSVFDIWTRLPGAREIAQSAGYTQGKSTRLYMGEDL